MPSRFREGTHVPSATEPFVVVLVSRRIVVPVCYAQVVRVVVPTPAAQNAIRLSATLPNREYK